MNTSLRQLTTSANRISLLESMGLYTIEDVAMHIPYRYEQVEEIWPADESGKICVEGHVMSDARVNFFRGKMSRMSFDVDIKGETYAVTIFNRHFLRPKLLYGTLVTITGKMEGRRITAANVVLKSLDEQTGLHPVYSLKEGLTSKQFAVYVRKAMKFLHQDNNLPDLLPPDYKDKRGVRPKLEALEDAHFPHDVERLKRALTSLKYEEFLVFQLTMQYMRRQRESAVGHAKDIPVPEVNAFLKTLPYRLTDDQQEAVKAILKDLSRPTIMYRFLQGDVGSGKTVVAMLGLYMNYLAGYQGVLLAPTEVLAHQHYETLQKFFKDTDVSLGLLVGALSPKDKDAVRQAISRGEYDIIIGTHALFQDKVTYKRLGLIVTDEQHRFGVRQRKMMREKGDACDFLVMSATPIPRTLALALFGDMDVSTIHTMPGGRKKVITRYVKGRSMKPFLEDVESDLAAGGQMYVICPLIEDSEAISLKSATQVYQAMSKYFKGRYEVGLLHGGMKDEEKNAVMREFENNEIQILVSTTVIEVGIDVANADRMVIYDSDRFGLSQLHQLRGRIGRGDKQGVCYLLSNSKVPEAIDRLKYMETHSDGFEVSQYDLDLRGPGEVLGEKQSGLPTFIVGDVFKDFDILQWALEDATEIMNDYYKYGEYGTLVDYAAEKVRDGNAYMD